jgi:hypothetical protein
MKSAPTYYIYSIHASQRGQRDTIFLSSASKRNMLIDLLRVCSVCNVKSDPTWHVQIVLSRITNGRREEFVQENRCT